LGQEQETGRLPADITAILCRGALARPDDRLSGEALSGGVSSDIWRVDAPGGPFCVKRALAKLKVRADWRAPTDRNAYEAAYLEVATRIAPGSVPELLHRDRFAEALVMRFLDPASHPLWKGELRDGRADPSFAEAVGERLAGIHRATARDAEVAGRFPSDAIFHHIRLEPYLLATARSHTDLGRQLVQLARRTAMTRLALVHGDVSPKNILVGPKGPVFLDAECAWFGDPAFDLAFCLNHLLLKCLWSPPAAGAFLDCFDALAESYLAGAVWEPRAGLEARVATLLPGLFLARIDGKSPVEYVTAEEQKMMVRHVARRFIEKPVETLMPIRTSWASEVGA
jgi:aminoglycoside phosphotransferase (APT) family kinase protein